MEFALVGFILISLLVAIFEVSIQIFAGMALDYGTRAAARFGVTGAPYPSSMASNPPGTRDAAVMKAIIVQATGNFLNPACLDVQFASYSTMPPTGSGNASPGGSGDTVRYQATYSQTFATSLAASLFASAAIKPACQPSSSAIQHQVVLWVENEPF